MFNYGELTIGGSRTVVIAEAGVNHLRDFELAERHIKEASQAGAHIIKFQTYDAEKLTTKNAPRFWSWDGESNPEGSQRDSYSKLATPERDFTEFLFETCKRYKIEFMSTPFDLASADMLNDLGSSGFKIASGDITNVPLLRRVGSFAKPVFLSTGASNIHEIKFAVELLKNSGCEEICIMHCTLCYPTRAEHANLSALLDLQQRFPGYVVGLSDHTIGAFIPALSVMYGCSVIEKHFTVDKKLPDSADHWLSIDPPELSQLMLNLEIAEKAKGNGTKGLLDCEEITRSNARRSLVVKGKIEKGEAFNQNNVTTKRPGSGISAVYFDKIIGMTASRSMSDDTIIQVDDVNEDAEFKGISPELLKSKPEI